MSDSRTTSSIPLLRPDVATDTATGVRAALDGHVLPESAWWRDWRPESTAFDRARLADCVGGAR